MENKEKQILVSTISSILILGFYSLYVYNYYIAKNFNIINDVQFWGKTFFILILVSIIGQIIVHILFAIFNKIITNEDMDMMMDERDHLIELKSIRIAHWMFVIGFLLAMGSQAIGMQVWVMFVTLIFSGVLSSTVSELVKIYFYRKGF